MKGFLVILLCPFICWLRNYQLSCSATASPLPGPHSVNNCPAPVWKRLSETPEQAGPPEKTWAPGAGEASHQAWASCTPPPLLPASPAQAAPGARWLADNARPPSVPLPHPSPQLQSLQSESLRLGRILGDTCLLDSLSFPPLIINCPLKSSERLTTWFAGSAFCQLNIVNFWKF